jgi:hypothetical protein
MKSCLVGGCGIDSKSVPMMRLDTAQRIRRALAGLLFTAVGAAGLYLPWWLWPVAAVAIWFGISHFVAAAIAYAGCPEVGAVASLFAGRHLATACGPWKAIDRRLDKARNAG